MRVELRFRSFYLTERPRLRGGTDKQEVAYGEGN